MTHPEINHSLVNRIWNDALKDQYIECVTQSFMFKKRPQMRSFL